jgi:O-antigen ligase
MVVTAALAYLAATPANSDQHLTSSDTAGRTDLWLLGWRIFETHPFIGVGSGNYEVTSVGYLNEPGLITRADLIVDTPLPTHNVYLQLLAELGIPGLLAFLAVAFAAASSGLRAATRFRDSGRTDLELAARCYVGALAAWMASNFFEPNQFAKQLWLLIALGPALLALAARESNDLSRSSTNGRDRIVRLRLHPRQLSTSAPRSA